MNITVLYLIDRCGFGLVSVFANLESGPRVPGLILNLQCNRTGKN